MGYFIEVEHLSELEKREKWEVAHRLLQEMWLADRYNSGKLIRLLSECWHVLSLWNCCIKTDNLDEWQFYETLFESAKFGLSNFAHEPKFLCIAGYMISLLPHLFSISDTIETYEEWEKKGKDMLRESHRLDPYDPVSEIFNIGLVSDLAGYNTAKKRILDKVNVDELFPNDTVIELYFKGILTKFIN